MLYEVQESVAPAVCHCSLFFFDYRTEYNQPLR